MKSVTGMPLPNLSAGETTYTPESDSNRMTGYTYDGAGNIISDGTRTFDYNRRGRLARVSEGSTVLAEYEYDVFGRRVKKVAGGATTFYHYDLNGLLIAETGADGSPLKYYVWLSGQPAAMRVAGSGGAWYYFLNDHLGTPQKLVNGSGNVAWEAAYLPFGDVQIGKADVENNLRFPGQYYDAETGLHYNWHRYYDPKTGRYITADPIGLEGGMNVYAYCANNPVNIIDHNGLNPNSPYCRRLLERIRNIEKKIQERLGELQEDPLELPERISGDIEKPSLSKYGHREILIKKDKANLAKLKAQYLAKCSDNTPPNGCPTGGESYFDRKFWEKTTGLTGAALMTYIIVSEGSRVLFPPRNLVPVP